MNETRRFAGPAGNAAPSSAPPTDLSSYVESTTLHYDAMGRGHLTQDRKKANGSPVRDTAVGYKFDPITGATTARKTWLNGADPASAAPTTVVYCDHDRATGALARTSTGAGQSDIRYAYTKSGALQSVTDYRTGQSTSYAYTFDGAMDSVAYTSGVKHDYTQDALGRTTGLVDHDGDGQVDADDVRLRSDENGTLIWRQVGTSTPLVFVMDVQSPTGYLQPVEVHNAPAGGGRSVDRRSVPARYGRERTDGANARKLESRSADAIAGLRVEAARSVGIVPAERRGDRSDGVQAVGEEFGVDTYTAVSTLNDDEQRGVGRPPVASGPKAKRRAIGADVVGQHGVNARSVTRVHSGGNDGRAGTDRRQERGGVGRVGVTGGASPANVNESGSASDCATL